MSTPLHQRMLAYWIDDPERLELNTRVWAGTPWMLDVETGSPDSDRRFHMATWCREHIGPEAWPIHGKPGNWYTAGATVDGWTWIGFATEALMREFMAAFPDHVKEPA